jgi:hypothetical protein
LLALSLPQTAQTHGRAQLQGLRLLAACDLQSLMKAPLSSLLIGSCSLEEPLASEPAHLYPCLRCARPALVQNRCRFSEDVQPFAGLRCFFVRLSDPNPDAISG